MLKYFVLSLLLLFGLDMIWFSWSVPNMYKPSYEAIQKSPLETRMVGGVVAWALLALGVTVFTVSPGNPKESFAKGALLGAIAYGVYNGTMYATLKDYPAKTAIIDSIWGTLAVGTTSLAMSFV
jgi:uncharacterized membrane protein